MRVVLDTNVFVSALLVDASLPDQLVTHWRQGQFVLLSATLQVDEMREVTRYPKIRARINPAMAGRLINELQKVAVIVRKLPRVDLSRDPFDNYLLAIAEAGRAAFLVTGDKSDLLGIGQYKGTSIVTVRKFMTEMDLLQ